jgi:hypothetical protein
LVFSSRRTRLQSGGSNLIGALTRRPIVTNPFSLIAGALALVSAFSPWWGISANNQPTFYFGLYPSSYESTLLATQLTQVLMRYSPFILVAAILSSSFGLIGGILRGTKYQLVGFALSVLTWVAYPIILMYSFAALPCYSWCILTPSGFAGGFTWGFQLGYYLALATTSLYTAAVLFQKLFSQLELAKNSVIVPAV